MTSTEGQIAAWNRYAEAKRRADRSLLIADGIAAVRAWKEFANLFLGEERQLPVDAIKGASLATFPVHKTRPPGGH